MHPGRHGRDCWLAQSPAVPGLAPRCFYAKHFNARVAAGFCHAKRRCCRWRTLTDLVVVASCGQFVGIRVGNADLLITEVVFIVIRHEREQLVFLALRNLGLPEAANDLGHRVYPAIDKVDGYPAEENLLAAASKLAAERK